MAGLRPRLATPMPLAILGRLKDREQSNVLGKLGFRAAETDAILSFADEAEAAGKELSGKKLNAPIDAYKFMEKMPWTDWLPAGRDAKLGGALKDKSIFEQVAAIADRYRHGARRIKTHWNAGRGKV